MQESAQTNEVRFNSILLVLGSLTAFGPLSIDMYLPSFPAIAEDLQTSLSSVQLSLAAFFIGLALGQMFYGPVTDKYGRKLPLYFGMGLYAVASLVCTFTKNVEMLIAFRFLQALGSCAGVVISRAAVRDLFSQQDTAKVFSLLMLITGIAPILAPLLGGYISTTFGWRAIFLLLAILSTACLFTIAFFLPETHPPDARIKIRDSFKIYKSIIRNRQFLGFALSGGAAQAGMFAYITGSPFVFINHFGIPADKFGWIFGTNALGLIISSQVNGRLLMRWGYEQILGKIYWWLAGTGIILAISGFQNWGFWGVIVPVFLFVASLGMSFPNSSAGAMATQKQSAGSASALLGTLQFSTSAIFSAIVSKLHDGTILPMCGTMAFCGLLSLVIYKLMVKPA